LEEVNYVGIRYCIKCEEETDHELIYLDKYLKAGRCLSCNQTFDNRGILIHIYYHDLLTESILLKPLMLYQELKESTKSQRKIPLFIRFVILVLKEPKKEFSNLLQMYRRHKFNVK
jgi:hypothetical protein